MGILAHQFLLDVIQNAFKSYADMQKMNQCDEHFSHHLRIH